MTQPDDTPEPADAVVESWLDESDAPLPAVRPMPLHDDQMRLSQEAARLTREQCEFLRGAEHGLRIERDVRAQMAGLEQRVARLERAEREGLDDGR